MTKENAKNVVETLQRYGLLTERGTVTEALSTMVAEQEACRLWQGFLDEGNDETTLRSAVMLLADFCRDERNAGAVELVLETLYDVANLTYPERFLEVENVQGICRYVQTLCEAVEALTACAAEDEEDWWDE